MATSNLTSEYDFGEITPVEVEIESKSDSPKLQKNQDPNVVLILSEYSVDNKVLEAFAKHGIKYSQLSQLATTDLLALGIEDEELRKRMVHDFTNLQGQDDGYDRVVKQFQDASEGTSLDNYSKNVCDQFQTQLMNLNLLIAASQIKLATECNRKSMLINNKVCSIEVINRILEQLTDYSRDMETLIVQMRQPSSLLKLHQEHERKKTLKKLTKILAPIALFIAGYFFIKRAKKML